MAASKTSLKKVSDLSPKSEGRSGSYRVAEHLHHIRIPVSDADIAAGVESNQFNCAIARAIERQFPDAVRVRVNSEKISFSLTDEDIRVEFPTPPNAVNKIIKPFDQRTDPEPTTVVLKGGKMRPRDHDSASRQDRKAKEKRDWMRGFTPEEKAERFPSVGRNTPAARKERVARARREGVENPQAKADYLRFCPDE